MNKKIILLLLIFTILISFSGSSQKLTQSWLDKKYFSPVDNTNKGTVLLEEIPNNSQYPHKYYIYLPYNYNTNTKYNILIFLHGYQGSGKDFTERIWNVWYGDPFKYVDIFDQLIKNELCEPFILIFPNYSQWWDLSYSHQAIAKEIKNYLIPHIVNNYSTYAKSSKYEDLIKAKNHIAIGGASLGGTYIFDSILRECSDICGNFCPMSAIALTPNLDNLIDNDININHFYYVTGNLETNEMTKTYEELIKKYPTLFNETNAYHCILQGMHHSHHTWACGLWNACQIMWK